MQEIGDSLQARKPSYTRAVLHYQGYSMFPFLRPGDRLIVERRICKPLQPGDIVLFEESRSPFGHECTAHRITGRMRGERYVTKGDNMPCPDPAVRGIEEITGRAVMLIRKKRVISLAGGLCGWLGPVIACLSRHNITPGLIASRLRRLREEIFVPCH